MRQAPITLETSIEDQEDWEPTSEEPAMGLEEIRESIKGWEEDMKVKGRSVSGRTMYVCSSYFFAVSLFCLGALREVQRE